MAEGREQSYLTPLEEQILQGADCEDLDDQLLREREAATHRLWTGFQDSATAVAHLFRDCQQQTGIAAWEPFHESASAVTGLYRGASEVCRQCMDSGARYGHKKRTKEVVAWVKKKKKHIHRDELLAFLLDKPYQHQQQQFVPPIPPHNQSITTSEDTDASSATVHQKLHSAPPGFMQGPSPISSPRRRNLADSDLYTLSGKEGSGRKRTATSSGGTNIFDFNMLGPDCKRIRL